MRHSDWQDAIKRLPQRCHRVEQEDAAARYSLL
jgi:hypothetical protein